MAAAVVGGRDDLGEGHVMTQVGHSSAAVMTEGGSCDDPGGSQLISRDDPTVTEGGAPWVFRAVHISLDSPPRCSRATMPESV